MTEPADMVDVLDSSNRSDAAETRAALARIEALAAALVPAIRNLDDRMGRIEDRMGRIEERMGRIEDRMGRLEHRVEKIETVIVGLDDPVRALEVTTAELKGRVLQLPTTIQMLGFILAVPAITGLLKVYQL